MDHRGEKPYTCDLCDAKFKLKTCLKRHFKVHSGEKPFECKTCGLKFSDSGHMKTHQSRVHEGVKPYKCKYCDRKFGSKVKNFVDPLMFSFCLLILALSYMQGNFSPKKFFSSRF